MEIRREIGKIEMKTSYWTDDLREAFKLAGFELWLGHEGLKETSYIIMAKELIKSQFDKGDGNEIQQ